MSKIITISEYNADSRQIGFAAMLKRQDRDYIKRAIKQGLVTGWFYTGKGASDLAEDDDAVSRLLKDSFAFLGNRFLVEITEIDEISDDDCIVKLSPFQSMEVSAEVDWDADEEEICPTVKTIIPSFALFDAGVLRESDDDPTIWLFNETKFVEWFGDDLSETYGFCHNGFTYRWGVKKNKE